MSRTSVAFCLASALLLGVPAASPQAAHAFEWLGHIAIDSDGLASADPQTRLASVRALARYDIEWTREHLLGALMDPDVHVRTAAARGLAAHAEERALPIIIKWLAMPDQASKQIGATILGEMKAQAAVPALVRALGDPDPTVRANSLIALGSIGGEAVIIPLVARLEDDKADVRGVAVQQLQALGDKRAVIPLVGLFRDSSQAVRIAAIAAVGSLGDRDASAALIRELGNRDSGVQIAAISALGVLEAKEGLSSVTSILASGTTSLRSKAAFSLAQIAKAHPKDSRSPEAIALLVETLAEPGMRNAAREALRTVGIAAVPHLIAHLDGERRGDPESAVELLEELGDVQATLALIRELSRGRIPQSTTLRALSSLGDSRALLPMLALLDDPSPAVRLGAMHGLEPLLGEPTAAADIMAERLADTDPRIRLLAARYLGKMRARSAVPKLIAAAAPGEEFILRATALQALGAIGDSRATPHALQYLASDTPALAAVAADVLSELADPTAVTRLLAIAHTVEHPSRIFAIEALGSTVRGKSDAKVADLFLSLARGHDQAGALAGIEALSCMRDERSGTALLRLLSTENPERQRAAAMALGALGHAPAFAPLLASLRTQPARVGSSVALALGELGNEKAIPQLISTSQRRGTARAVNASAALARLATPNHTQEIAPLLLHANALVRINALAALGRNKDAHLASKIERMLSNDPSWLVRIASARTLSMLGSSTEALRRASEQDDRREVRKAAKELLETAYVPVDTNRWSVFRIVDPLRNDRPIAHEARFFIGADGIATVGISDIRGRIYSQTFPEGPYVQGPLSNLSGF